MKIGKRNIISGFLYVAALLLFLVAITANSRGSMLDFSDIARVIFCGLSVICVIAATLLGKATNAKSGKFKLIIMIVAIALIVGGGFLDKYLDHNTGTKEYTGDMIKISEAVAAKFETADGKSVFVDGEIAQLRSLSELDIQQAPLTPADSSDDWIYRITFNPVEKVPNGEEIVVYVHEKYLQIGIEYYLPCGNVEFDSILEWFEGKAAYFITEETIEIDLDMDGGFRYEEANNGYFACGNFPLACSRYHRFFVGMHIP